MEKSIETHASRRQSLGAIRWPSAGVFLVLAALLAFLWGMAALVTAGQGSDQATPSQNSVPDYAAAPSLGSDLPKAWASATRVPTASATPTPFPTFTPTRQRSSTPTLSPTPSPTATASPTPTPIHRPADGDPTRITAPSIGLDARVVTVRPKEQYEHGVLRRVWDVADYAVGFHAGMARPGHVGNTVLTGHNNVRGEVFRNLYKLQPGDDVFVWVGAMPYHYRVSVIYRLPLKDAPPQVLEDNLRWINPTNDQRLTLVTCWPPWSNTHRIIVVAFPAPWEG